MNKHFILAAVLLFPSAAAAQDWRGWALGERARVGVGAFYSDLQTIASASDRNGSSNATISFEDDLGLDSSESTLIGFVDWRIAKRHSVVFNYFELNRSGRDTSGVGLRLDFGDLTFVQSVDLPVRASFDIEVYDIGYRYSPVFDEKKEFFVGIGLSLQELRFGLSGNVPVDPGDLLLPGFDCSQGSGCNFAVEEVDTTAPLPTFELGGSYAVNDQWQLLASAGYFAISLELDPNEDFSGRIWTTSFGVRWKLFDHLGLFGNYSYFDVDVDYQKRNLVGVLDYRYKGPIIGFEAFF